MASGGDQGESERTPDLPRDAAQGGDAAQAGKENASPREIRLDLPAAHSAVRMARQLVRTFATEFVQEEELGDLELVISELLSNAVDHGGGGAAMTESDLAKPVRMLLALDISPVRWVVEVSDQGGGDPEDIEDMLNPDGLPDLESERGRGFFLLSTMVDKISVAHSEDKLGLTIRAEKGHGQVDS